MRTLKNLTKNAIRLKALGKDRCKVKFLHAMITYKKYLK